MTTKSWHGIPSIQEVECTGQALGSDSDVLSMAIFSLADNSVLTSVNLRKNECSTTHSFSACEISHDSRNTRLVTLVMDLREGETRVLGCNVTSFRTGGHSAIYSWSLQVCKGPGKLCAPTEGHSTIDWTCCKFASSQVSCVILQKVSPPSTEDRPKFARSKVSCVILQKVIPPST